MKFKATSIKRYLNLCLTSQLVRSIGFSRVKVLPALYTKALRLSKLSCPSNFWPSSNKKLRSTTSSGNTRSPRRRSKGLDERHLLTKMKVRLKYSCKIWLTIFIKIPRLIRRTIRMEVLGSVFVRFISCVQSIILKSHIKHNVKPISGRRSSIFEMCLMLLLYRMRSLTF